MHLFSISILCFKMWLQDDEYYHYLRGSVWGISYLFLACNAEADVVFLLDSSGSVGATNFKKMLKFIQGVVSKFSVGLNNIQVGIDTFQSTVKSEFKLNQFLDKNDLITAIGNIVYKTGGTKTGPAIKFMTTNSFSTAAG